MYSMVGSAAASARNSKDLGSRALLLWRDSLVMAAPEIGELIAAVRGLAPAKRRELLERFRFARELPAESTDPLGFVGMYADEPELIDFVCEDAMQTRERGKLQELTARSADQSETGRRSAR